MTILTGRPACEALGIRGAVQYPVPVARRGARADSPARTKSRLPSPISGDEHTTNQGETRGCHVRRLRQVTELRSQHFPLPPPHQAALEPEHPEGTHRTERHPEAVERLHLLPQSRQGRPRSLSGARPPGLNAVDVAFYEHMKPSTSRWTASLLRDRFSPREFSPAQAHPHLPSAEAHTHPVGRGTRTFQGRRRVRTHESAHPASN